MVEFRCRGFPRGRQKLKREARGVDVHSVVYARIHIPIVSSFFQIPVSAGGTPRAHQTPGSPESLEFGSSTFVLAANDFEFFLYLLLSPIF